MLGCGSRASWVPSEDTWQCMPVRQAFPTLPRLLPISPKSSIPPPPRFRKVIKTAGRAHCFFSLSQSQNHFPVTKLFSSLYSSMLLQSAWVAGVSGVARVHAGKECHPRLPARPQGPRPPRSRACAVRGGVGGAEGGGGGVGVGGGRGRAVGKPRTRDCALPAGGCFRFSISSQ